MNHSNLFATFVCIFFALSAVTVFFNRKGRKVSAKKRREENRVGRSG